MRRLLFALVFSLYCGLPIDANRSKFIVYDVGIHSLCIGKENKSQLAREASLMNEFWEHYVNVTSMDCNINLLTSAKMILNIFSKL